MASRMGDVGVTKDEEAPGMRGAAPRTFDLMQDLVYGANRGTRRDPGILDCGAPF